MVMRGLDTRALELLGLTNFIFHISYFGGLLSSLLFGGCYYVAVT
jgi:hypothetical protein